MMTEEQHDQYADMIVRNYADRVLTEQQARLALSRASFACVNHRKEF